MESKTKSAVYLPIQSNHAQSETSLQIKMNYGYAGYGIYFELLQRLTAEPTRTLSIDNLKALAYGMHITLNELQPIVTDFFTTKDNIFYSEYLNESLIYFDEKYNKDSNAGKKSASLLTPEQRVEKAKKAIATRWNKDEKQVNDIDIPTLSINNTNPQYNNTNPQNVDTNNKIEENRIEENRIKQNKTETEEKKKEENKTQTFFSEVKQVVIKQKLSEKVIIKLTEILKGYNKQYPTEKPKVIDTFYFEYVGFLVYYLRNQQNVEIDNYNELESIITQSNQLTNEDLNKYLQLCNNNEEFLKKIINNYIELNLEVMEFNK